MAATWDHPQLGRFEYGEGGWAKELDFPAFKAFAYRTRYDHAGRSTGKQGMLFWASGPNDVPSPETAAVGAKVVANQADLVAKVTEALWDTFNGRGPDYGSWHGCLEDLTKLLGPKRPLRAPKDVLRLLRANGVYVRSPYPGVSGLDRPAAAIQFYSAFEPEHGVGVLTDGDAILGMGYWLDVVLFETPKRSPKRSRR